MANSTEESSSPAQGKRNRTGWYFVILHAEETGSTYTTFNWKKIRHFCTPWFRDEKTHSTRNKAMSWRLLLQPVSSLDLSQQHSVSPKWVLNKSRLNAAWKMAIGHRKTPRAAQSMCGVRVSTCTLEMESQRRKSWVLFPLLPRDLCLFKNGHTLPLMPNSRIWKRMNI